MEKVINHVFTFLIWVVVTWGWTYIRQGDLPDEVVLRMIVGYAILINIVGWLAMFVDKRSAVMKKRRISENMLFRITALGGGLGTILGMRLFRHKTKHRSFVILLPLMTLVQYGIVIGWTMF